MVTSPTSSDPTVPPDAAAKTTLAVFKSPRHDLMYVYLPVLESTESPQTSGPDSDDGQVADLSILPPELLQRFGHPVFTLTIELWIGRKLAQADAAVVLEAVARQGFYLQMPPTITLPPTPDALNVHS